MKRILLSSLFILFSFVGFAQQTIINDTVKPFGNITYSFNNICEDDAFIYIMGSVNNAIVKFDKNLNIINKRTFDYDTFYYISYPYNSLIENNNKLVFCAQAVDTNNVVYGVIVELDKSTLDTNWIKEISHPDTIAASQPGADVWSELTAIKPTPDGGYILTGNYNKNCVTGNLRSFLLKIDSIGNVEWRKTYDDIYKLFDIELLDSGGYIFIKKYWGTHIVKTDSLGNIIWTKEINTETPYATVESIKRLNSNEYIGLVKYVKATSPTYYYGFNIFKININSKQVLWDKLYNPYHTIECQTLHEAMGLEILNNGELVVSGTAYDGDNFGFLFKLNSNGDSLWSKRYAFGPQGDDNCQINDLLVTDNNEFLGVGFYAPNSSNMAAWIFKTDSNGVLGIENKELGIRNEELRVFPNPANDFVNIEIDKPNLKLSYYKIFDSQGKLVLSNDFVSDRINVRSLSQGVYFIECDSEDGEVFSGKFFRN